MEIQLQIEILLDLVKVDLSTFIQTNLCLIYAKRQYWELCPYLTLSDEVIGPVFLEGFHLL